MIGRQFRFRGHSSLGFVYNRGTTVRGHNMSLRYIPNQRQQHYRAAVVVSRKVHKSAVVRNRIRRRLYELIRQEVPANLAPYDLVFTVFSDAVADMPAAELKKAVRTLLAQAKLG